MRPTVEERLVHAGRTLDAALAAKAGVSAASIETIRTNQSHATLTADEQLIARFVLQLLREKKVPDDTFNAAQNLLGTQGVVDLTLTCGYYTAINMAQIALKPEMVTFVKPCCGNTPEERAANAQLRK